MGVVSPVEAKTYNLALGFLSESPVLLNLKTLRGAQKPKWCGITSQRKQLLSTGIVVNKDFRKRRKALLRRVRSDGCAVRGLRFGVKLSISRVTSSWKISV